MEVIGAGIDKHSFNPRPCARGDCCGGRMGIDIEFQSTPLREGRRAAEIRVTIPL